MNKFYSLKVLNIDILTKESVCIKLDTTSIDDGSFDFIPGQYITIKHMINNEDVRRSYSISSVPGSAIEIGVKLVKSGRMSTYLTRQLQVGDSLEVMPPTGSFTLETNPDNEKHYMAICAGSGITPILSMIGSVLNNEPLSSFTLLYGNKDRSNIMFLNELLSFEKEFQSQFFIYFAFSREKTTNSIYGRIDSENLTNLFNEHTNLKHADSYFLCGPGEMIDNIDQFLLDNDISKEKIIRSMVGKDLSDNFPERTGNINENIVIDVNNVHTKNIRNINFKIKAGEVLGIAGLSNSGQREIFNMLMGVDNIAKGKISFMDQKYEPNSPSDAWKKLISFVPRERRKEALMLKMSVKSNTTTPHYSKLSKFFFLANKQQENLITNNYSKKVQLKYENINQSIYQLSGGNQQKVVFSRALASNPKLLLLDEPTRGVDVGAKLDIYNLIIQLTKNGCGIVLNSSDLSEIMGMCDKILILKDHEQYKILENFKINSQDVLANFYESKKQ